MPPNKTRFFWLSTALALLALASTLTIRTNFWRSAPNFGNDITLRMNEIACLKERLNPADVFHGTIDHPPYYRLSRTDPPDSYTRPIDIYTPWEYTFLMPLSALPEPWSESIWLAIILLAIVFLWRVAYGVGKHLNNDISEGLFTAATALALPLALFSDSCVSNFSTIICAATALMSILLNRKHDVLAGICLSIIMIKPQLGALIAVPLLMRRRIVTLVTGAAICLTASIPPAVLCNTSPVDLILQIFQGGGAIGFSGCDLMPFPLPRIFNGLGLPSLIPLVIAATAGLSLCIPLTRKLSNCHNWLYILMPATLLSTAWTYSTAGNRMMHYFLLLAVAVYLLKQGDPRLVTPFWGLMILNLRPCESLHTFLIMSSGVLSSYQIPRETAKWLITIESEILFVSSLFLAYWLVRRLATERS